MQIHIKSVGSDYWLLQDKPLFPFLPCLISLSFSVLLYLSVLIKGKCDSTKEAIERREEKSEERNSRFAQSCSLLPVLILNNYCGPLVESLSRRTQTHSFSVQSMAHKRPLWPRKLLSALSQTEKKQKEKEKEGEKKRGMGSRNKEGTFSLDRLRAINVTCVECVCVFVILDNHRCPPVSRIVANRLEQTSELIKALIFYLLSIIV